MEARSREGFLTGVNVAFSYPLKWPAGQPRNQAPEKGRFDTPLLRAAQGLEDELRLMGAQWPTITCNLQIRQDGLPYARQGCVEDTGVAVYFEWRGRELVFACDRWTRVENNVQAVRLTVQALRGIERWGSSDMMAQAFAGFKALPEPAQDEPWWETLGLSPEATLEEINQAYRRLAKENHPDAGGLLERMYRINRAVIEAREERKQ